MSVTTKTRNCVHRFSPNWVCRWSSDHLQLIKFWRSCALGKGVCSWGKILALPYYSHRGLCASMGGLRWAHIVCVSLSAFSFPKCFLRFPTRELYLPRCGLVSYCHPQRGHIGSSFIFSKVKYQFTIFCPVRRPAKIFKSFRDSLTVYFAN